MGIHTYTTTTPFKLDPYWSWQDENFPNPIMEGFHLAIMLQIEEEIATEEDLQNYINEIKEEEEWTDYIDPKYFRFSYNGWRLDNEETFGGNPDTVWGWKLVKDGFKPVIMINESEYSTVGCYEIVFVGEDKSSLEELQKDFGISRKIVENTVTRITS